MFQLQILRVKSGLETFFCSWSFFFLGLNISVKNPPNVHLFNEEYLSNWIQNSPDLTLVEILDVNDFIESDDVDDDLDVTDEFDDSVEDE